MPDNSLAGIQGGSALGDNVRKTMAFNALRSVYGDVAGDPDLAAKLQENAQKAKLDPIAVDQAQATLAGTQAQTAGVNATTDETTTKTQGAKTEEARDSIYRTATYLKGVVNSDDGSKNLEDEMDKHVKPNMAAWGLDPAHYEAMKSSIARDPSQLDSVIKSNMPKVAASTMALTSVQNPDGTVTSGTVDKRDNSFHPLTGAAPGAAVSTAVQGAQRANTGTAAQIEKADNDAKKLPIAQQNANSAALAAGSAAANRKEAADAPGGKAPAAPEGQKPQVTAALARMTPAGRKIAIGQAQQIATQAANLATTNTILDNVDKQISPYTAGTGSLLSKLPGTVQKDLKSNLETLSAQGLTTWIQSLKNAQGQTGVGRVLQSEANAAMKLYGNMEQDQSAKQLAFHATLFRQSVNRLHALASKGFKTSYGIDSKDLVGGDDEPAAPAAAAPAPGDFSHLWK